MNAKDMRERQVNVRLSPSEAERVDRLASHFGLNPQALVRMLIKRADDELTGAGSAPPPKASPKKPSSKR